METAMLQANALTTLPALKAALGMSDEDISSDSLLIQLINRPPPPLSGPWGGSCVGATTWSG